jgi:zinc protease
MEASLHGTNWAFTMTMGNDAFDLIASTNKGYVESQLQVLAAYATDPGFRPLIDERLPDAIDIMTRMYGSNPDAMLAEALIAAVDPGNPEAMPPRAVMDRWRSADFARLLKPALTTAPIELTIVGDVSEAVATRYVGRTFGALPARPVRDRARADTRFLRFPDRPVPVIRATHQGPVDRGAVRLVWPLYVATPARRAEEYALKLVAAIFDTELRQRVRTELGKSYAPNVSTDTPDEADQGLLAATIAANPADLDGLVVEAQATARRIAAGGITAEMLEAARRPMLTQAAALRGRNAWWTAALDGSARNPALLVEAAGFQPLLESLTLDQVKAAAATWLSRPPIVVIVTPAKLAVPPAAAAAPDGRKGGVR